MASHFINSFTHSLATSSPTLSSATLEDIDKGSKCQTDAQIFPTKNALHALLASFPHSQLLTQNQIDHAVSVLSDSGPLSSSTVPDPEEVALRSVVLAKVTVGLYAEALNLYLTQATQVETEADWWGDIERSRFNIAWYLLQTIPTRLFNVVEAVITVIRSQNLPFSITTFTPSSLARLFPTSPASPFKPSALATAFFPHLSKTSLAVTASLYPPTIAFSPNVQFTAQISNILSYYFTLIVTYTTYPLSLIRQECRVNRRELETIRNERAEILGQLSQLRNSLSSILANPEYEYFNMTEFLPKIQRFVEILDQKAAKDVDIQCPSPTIALAHLSNETLPRLKSSHHKMLKTSGLLRPRRWILMWPNVILFPPLALFACKSLYASRANLEDVARDAVETLKGFVRGWLLEPLRDVLRTVRSGSSDAEGVLVRREGVLADLDSLERMTLSLARDELRYDQEQVAALSRQIRLGDMTPVMQIYEKDIRTPLKSAIAGTLLRNVFIQIQKAKVDIDQALTGIDRLLKSQELTFAFVGVAPALAIVYLAGNAIAGVWIGGKGRSRYGRLQTRRGAWGGIRRIEKLLITQPVDNQQVAALPSGLLLLSLARLRAYAVDNLPPNSRLREGFLEDLSDLENPDLGRNAKLDVVRRMWRCWGVQLGWEHCGEYY